MISELEAVSILSELKGFARSTDDEPSRRILHELRAPVSALELPKLITLGPDMHLLHALRQMESEESRVAVIQETRDTILGAVSKRALEDLLCEPDAGDRVLARSQMTLSVDRGTEDSPVITMVMNRNVSIETSDATILEVVERMTVGACPFVVLVNEYGHPCSVLDPLFIASVLTIPDTLTARWSSAGSSFVASQQPKIRYGSIA